MVTLLHISDLHFGQSRIRKLADAILRAEEQIAPSAVVCSGDLVEFAEWNGPWREVSAFLKRLISPLLVIPGNHDIERINVWNRLWRPLGRYHQFVNAERDTILEVPGAVLVGLGTPRRWSLDLGHVSREQLSKARDAFARAGETIMKVVAIHHGPHTAGGNVLRDRVWGAERACRELLQMGADLVLSGHNHFPHAQEILGHERAMIWSQAGSAGSNRLFKKMAQHNSLSVVRREAGAVSVETWHYDDASGRFEPVARKQFARP